VLVGDRLALLEHLLQLCTQATLCVRPRSKLPQLLPDDGAILEHLQLAAAEEDRPVGVDDEHEIGRGLDECTPQLFVLLAVLRMVHRLLLLPPPLDRPC
jgi:hypothetical protein